MRLGLPQTIEINLAVTLELEKNIDYFIYDQKTDSLNEISSKKKVNIFTTDRVDAW